MATQGIVSIVKDGATVVKAVAGSDGMKAHELADEIIAARLERPDAIMDAARSVGFGSIESLVVQSADGDLYEGDDELGPLYREKFDEPEFNPRWEQGTADHVVILDLSAASGPKIRNVY